MIFCERNPDPLKVNSILFFHQHSAASAQSLTTFSRTSKIARPFVEAELSSGEI